MTNFEDLDPQWIKDPKLGWMQVHAAEAAAWAEILARPADWTLPNGEIYSHVGPGVDAEGKTKRVLGTWVPNVRNANATVYTFLPSDVPGESEEERTARLEAGLMTPAKRREDRDIKMSDALMADSNREPVATIRCSQCTTPRKMAKVYKIGRTYFVADGSHFTFAEARITHLNMALAAREQGHRWLVELEKAAADVKEWPVSHALDPLPKDHYMHDAMKLGMDCLLIGCRSHGNAMFSYAWLRDCGKKAEDVMVNPTERFYVLSSEKPTFD